MNNILPPRFGANTLANVLLKYNYKVKTGDILAGTVLGIERTQTLINLGLKHIAFLPNNEIIGSATIKSTKNLMPNETGEFLILYYDPKTDKTIVSIQRLQYLRLWERFKQIDYKNMILFTIFQKNIGSGKLLNFDGLDIFIPNLHLPKYYRRKKFFDNNINIPIKILEVKDKTYHIIGSCRLAFLKKQSACLQVGMIQNGTVIAVKPYGLLLNISGIKCLLHISEISNKKIDNLMALYKRGDQIFVKVIYVNTSQGKIALSAKQITS